MYTNLTDYLETSSPRFGSSAALTTSGELEYCYQGKPSPYPIQSTTRPGQGQAQPVPYTKYHTTRAGASPARTLYEVPHDQGRACPCPGNPCFNIYLPQKNESHPEKKAGIDNPTSPCYPSIYIQRSFIPRRRRHT